MTELRVVSVALALWIIPVVSGVIMVPQVFSDGSECARARERIARLSVLRFADWLALPAHQRRSSCAVR